MPEPAITAAERKALASPGRMTADRARFERDMLAALAPELEAFVAAVKAEALAALDLPVILAAAKRASLRDAFTLGRVQELWGTSKRAMEVYVREFLTPPEGPTPDQLIVDYLEGLNRRLDRLALPDEVYTAVRETIVQGQHARWTKAEFSQALDEVLSLDTGKAVPRPEKDRVETKGRTFRTLIHQFIRTESTAAFNVRKMERQRRAGYSWKRWVAHHDNRTRPTHANVSGTTIPQNQDFIVGGSAMAYPGDPRGPIKETAQCRCVLIGARAPG